VHWRAGGASEQLADFLVGERALALIVRRGGFRYLNTPSAVPAASTANES
jgi:hypothetical protein